MESKKPLVLSTVAVCISLASLLFVWIRCKPVEVEPFGVIVSALSILVTVLIGFQIYNYISFRTEMKIIVDDTIKNAFDNFFHVFTGYIDASTCNVISMCYTIEIFDDLMNALNEISKSKDPNMNFLALNFIMAKLVSAVTHFHKYDTKCILHGKRSYYLNILRKVNHDDAKYIIDYINEAQDKLPESNN